MQRKEIVRRVRGVALQVLWRRRMGERWRAGRASARWAGGTVPAVALDAPGRAETIHAAERVLAGEWHVFGYEWRAGDDDPDWFSDPATGRRSPHKQYCFRVPYRNEGKAGNIKVVWEISRLHHVTLLATAYACTGRLAFAERAVAHLQSWWRCNPPLTGVNWVSGIELGIRLIAWVWTRRLLTAMPGIASVFEGNEAFRRQLHAHQSWIARFGSFGSSANNHLIAEAAGMLAASLAFPIFPESGTWAQDAARTLEREIARQTFADGLNRELAGGYHVFALELLLVAAVEADGAGRPLSNAFWRRLREMTDALAANVGPGLGVPRQGDDDNGRALMLEPASVSGAAVVLGTGSAIFAAASWWPDLPELGLTARWLASRAASRPASPDERSSRMPTRFAEAGIAILRTASHRPQEEIWCRFDAGPHGFLSTAAHAHADALSFELQVGEQPVLVDPGTFSYHGEPEWRDYFRSTLAHNTLELGRRDQADHAGPFLWLTAPAATVVDWADEGEMAAVEAWHDGYLRLSRPTIHRRRLCLMRSTRSLEVIDTIEGGGAVVGRLAFHLHPAIRCEMRAATAYLQWRSNGESKAMRLALPHCLTWTAHRGETNPIRGWYAPAFGRKNPTTMLLGSGTIMPGQALRTRIVVSARAAELLAA
ncbi:MAG: alginate lyase family protein [Acetobacteraceae bacterium]|nr:alginate lyase family protein [Acetobacteraceae bacterium]